MCDFNAVKGAEKQVQPITVEEVKTAVQQVQENALEEITATPEQLEDVQVLEVEELLIQQNGIPQVNIAAPPPVLIQEQPQNTAALSKRQKRELKKRQERDRAAREANREMLRHEAEQVQKEREKQERQQRIKEERANIERERLEKREPLIAGNIEPLAEIAQAKSGSAEEIAHKKQLIKDMFFSMKDQLIASNPELENSFRGTADFVAGAKCYRLVLLQHAEDPAEGLALFNELEERTNQFGRLAMRNTELRIISNEIRELMDEEFQSEPLFEEVSNELWMPYQVELDTALKEFTQFEGRICAAIGLENETSKNIFDLRKDLRYAKSPENADYIERKAAELKESVGCTAEEAYKLAAETIMLESRENFHTRLVTDGKDSVVSDLSKEQLNQYGGAYSKLKASEPDARKMVEKSGGFLYTVKGENGMFEVRPTLPEKFTGNGYETEFRKNYNRFTKSIAQQMITKDGKLSKNAASFAAKIEELRDYFNSVEVPDKEVTLTKLKAVFGSGYDKMFGKDALDELAGFFVATTDNYDSLILPMEFTNMLSGFPDSIPQIPLAKMRKRLVDEGQEVSDDTLRDMYKDADNALAEMLKLREMNPDDKGVFLFGACSASGPFVNKIRRRQGAPDNVIQYNFSEGESQQRKIRDYYKEYRAKSGEPFDENTPIATIINELKGKNLLKYDYHTTGTLGVLEDSNTSLTLETFAPESTQLVGSPLTSQIYMGVYKDGGNGMKGYYDFDGGMATEEDIPKTIAKPLIRNIISGG